MEVIAGFRRLLTSGDRIHDCYAGNGERLGALADEMGLIFTGTELEPEFIGDPRVYAGNACNAADYPSGLLCGRCGMRLRLPLAGGLPCPSGAEHEPVGLTVVTSPVYPNGIADDFHAQDESKRRTYRSTLAKILGHDRPLHVDNAGRWGYRGTPLHSTRRGMYWNITSRTIDAWNTVGVERALVNVSDFKAGNRYEPVVDGWLQRLQVQGWTLKKAHKVDTPRDGYGANQGEKADYEVILDVVPT